MVYLAAYPILNAIFGTSVLTLGIYLPLLVVEPLLTYRFGRVQETLHKAVSKGLRITVGYALLQMLLGFWAPPTPTFIYFLGELLLDYLVAFMVLGTAEFFARPFKNRMVGVAVGTFMAGFLRFMCSFLSGELVWGNLNEGLSAWTYSLVYTGSYMLPETLLTMVAAVLLCRVAPQIFDRQHAKA